MLSAAGQAFSDVFTPPFRAVLLKCVGFTIALLALLIVGIEWTFSHFVEWPGWIEKAIEWLGGLALVVGSIFLIAPVTSLIAGFYLDDIAALVEREHYPADPPGRALPTLEATGVALRFFFAVLLVNLAALFLLLIPGVNLVAFYLGNGYLLGREYFELAAMRHLAPAEAKTLRRANRLTVILAGLVIAAIATVPILNLITPLFATGFMVRVYKNLSRRAGLRPSLQPR
ncbi:MAG: sulfate transporter family protein [Methyloceanibacter sp.]